MAKPYDVSTELPLFRSRIFDEVLDIPGAVAVTVNLAVCPTVTVVLAG